MPPPPYFSVNSRPMRSKFFNEINRLRLISPNSPISPHGARSEVRVEWRATPTQRKSTMAETITIPRPPLHRDDARQKVPHTFFMRELTMLDGRKILVDKRAIAFVCQGKPEEFEGKPATIVAWKTWAKAVPVAEGYDDLKSWWRGDKAGDTAREGSSA